jgi:hypothetical protein
MKTDLLREGLPLEAKAAFLQPGFLRRTGLPQALSSLSVSSLIRLAVCGQRQN